MDGGGNEGRTFRIQGRFVKSRLHGYLSNVSVRRFFGLRGKALSSQNHPLGWCQQNFSSLGRQSKKQRVPPRLDATAFLDPSRNLLYLQLNEANNLELEALPTEDPQISTHHSLLSEIRSVLQEKRKRGQLRYVRPSPPLVDSGSDSP